MATKKKLLQAAAGQAGGAVLNIEDVFSTYLYEGNASTQTITNGIDLSGEGGLVWVKNRTYAYDHYLYDTERGATKYLSTNDTGAEATNSNSLTSFNSNGFTLGLEGDLNGGGHDVASWTFRKAPKFFDVVTYTGDGVAGRTVSHNLGSVPGCIMVKCTSAGANWVVYHRGTDAIAPEDYGTKLSSTAAREDNVVFWNDTAPTSTEFTLGTGSLVNSNGATYVAYLFAHNDGDGEFGPDGDADIIKCGSFTANSGGEVEIDVGFEPQWILTKSTASSGWFIFDAMRGMSHTSTNYVQANESNAEAALTTGYVKPTATGWIDSWYGGTPKIIYIAIRRGPMAVPESGTEVFDVSDGSAGASGNAGRYRSGFPVDMALEKVPSTTDNWEAVTRLLQGTSLRPNDVDAEDTGVGAAQFDYMDGWNNGSAYSSSYSWMWKRAPNYFDVVAYTGVGGDMTLDHNLGVAPDMMWVKKRSGTGTWYVYDSINGHNKNMELNTTAATTGSGVWANTAPTDTQFTVSGLMTSSGGTYIAYLFASLDGVSKVGSYTGTGATQTIDCGFTSGARFVLTKRSSTTGVWGLFDTERGIVAGNEPLLRLNGTNAETSSDYIDPHSSGFELPASSGFNTSGITYIFYAIA